MTSPHPSTPPAGAATDAAPALLLDSVRFAYDPRGPRVVDVARLRLGRGEQMLLTARSGAGKSTLLHLIAGVLDLRPPLGAGTIAVDGVPIQSLPAARRDAFRGRRIGMIFQTFHLLPGFTAIENVMAALLFSSVPPREHRLRAGTLLRRLGVERLDAPAEALSVGQQQRVAVARAVVCDPALVLADEPTASLDPQTASEAMDVIQQACRERGAALLCVSHDPAMAARFQRRAALSDLAAQPAATPPPAPPADEPAPAPGRPSEGPVAPPASTQEASWR